MAEDDNKNEVSGGGDPFNRFVEKKLDFGRANELSVSEIINFQDTFLPMLMEKRGGWKRSDLREMIKRTVKTEKELVLRGPVKILRGERPVLAVTHGFLEAIDITYDIFPGNLISNEDNYYAVIVPVDNATQKEIKLPLKIAFSIDPEDKDDIIISEGAARMLNVESGAVIKIGGIYQELSGVNLDEL